MSALYGIAYGGRPVRTQPRRLGRIGRLLRRLLPQPGTLVRVDVGARRFSREERVTLAIVGVSLLVFAAAFALIAWVAFNNGPVEIPR